MPTVHVHIDQPTARAYYAITQVLERLLGWSIVWHTDAARCADADGPKLVYGRTMLAGALCITPAGLLEETSVAHIDPRVSEHMGVPVLFAGGNGVLPYDPFAAAFFHLTRYEEVAGVEQDEHGRPVGARLHAARNGYLRRPVVDEWALQLAAAWRSLDPHVPEPVRKYKQMITIDLDNGFMYRGRAWWRTAGSALRDLLRGDVPAVGERWRVLRGRQDDPYDIYDRLRVDLAPHSDAVLFFVLNAPRGTWDHAVPLSFAPYAERLSALMDWSELGIHPSYTSSTVKGVMERERGTLSELLRTPIQSSRQHFLRMRLPETYRELAAIGITEEHSMGLHDLPGFRAGTCTPYQWFDLGLGSTVPLTIHPFMIMDNTLRVKLKLDPEAAITECEDLIHHVRRVNGTFTGLWHESFLSDHGTNKGWRDPIMSIINNARA